MNINGYFQAEFLKIGTFSREMGTSNFNIFLFLCVYHLSGSFKAILIFQTVMHESDQIMKGAHFKERL